MRPFPSTENRLKKGTKATEKTKCQTAHISIRLNASNKRNWTMTHSKGFLLLFRMNFPIEFDCGCAMCVECAPHERYSIRLTHMLSTRFIHAFMQINVSSVFCEINYSWISFSSFIAFHRNHWPHSPCHDILIIMLVNYCGAFLYHLTTKMNDMFLSFFFCHSSNARIFDVTSWWDRSKRC